MKYIFLICSVILFFACSNSTNFNRKADNGDLLVLDFDQTLVEDTLSASSFIESVMPVFLETTDDNLIGFLSAMQVTSDYICILDGGPGGSNRLFVFGKAGKYLRSIGKQGQGPGEYLNIHDFTINEEEDEIFIIDDVSSKISVYKLSTGAFIRDILFADENVKYRNIQYVNNKLFTDITYFTQTEAGPMMYALNELTGTIETKYLDIAVHNHGWLKPFSKGESFFYCKNSDKPKYIHYFMDTMMVVNNGILEPYMHVKSKDWVTGQIVQENRNHTDDMQEDAYFKIQELQIAFNIQNYVESEKYIYFTYDKQRKSIKVIYDKNRKQLLRTKFLSDDILFTGRNYMLPLIGCGDEYGMYGYINTATIPYLYEYIMNHDASAMKSELRAMFKSKVTSDSNPILLYYKYK